ncbi:MAG TPA: permease prefix domain 2-containing transporter, partial [Cytophagales bacterium]
MKQPAPPPPPPRWAKRLLHWLHPPETLEEVAGDLIELYGAWYRQGGKRQARRRYWWGVLSVLPPLVRRRPTKNESPTTAILLTPMLRNYFLLAWRNLLRHRVSAFINLFGLAVGMVVAMLIGLWVYDELTFNRNHENYESIVKVYQHKSRKEEVFTTDNHVTGLGSLLGTAYGNHFKRVVMVRARIEDRVVAYGDKKFTQSGYFMQPAGPEMLTLDMVYGSRQGLRNMKSILLSETVAAKLFGHKDPVNQIVKMDGKWDLLVTGVYRDLPNNSEFAAATYLAPLDLYLDGWARLDAWDNSHM